MALMTGNDGDVTFGGTSLPSRAWTLNEEATEKEVTNSNTASANREFLGDRAGATWTCEAYVDNATATTGVSTGATTTPIELLADDTGTTDKKWAFAGLILGKEILTNVAGGDAVLVRYSGRVSGAITETQFS